MSDDEGEGATVPELNALLVKQLLDYAEVADDKDLSFKDARGVAQVLFAMVASAKMNPAAIPAVVDDGRHPMHARQFAAVNASYTNQSWGMQEQRVLNRYRKAAERVASAKLIVETADASLKQAQAELDEVSNDMVLTRLYLTMRGVQDFVRPALEAGPLVTLMLGILGDPSSANDPASEKARADAKRTLEVLSRRIGDDVFLERMGHLVRSFVTAYDDEAGADGRLTPAAAESLRDELLANSSAMRTLREVAAGGATSSDGEEEEDEFAGLPF